MFFDLKTATRNQLLKLAEKINLRPHEPILQHERWVIRDALERAAKKRGMAAELSQKDLANVR